MPVAAGGRCCSLRQRRAGGIVGTIVSITGDTLILRVKPDNVKLQVARSAVSGLVNPEKSTEEKK